MCYTNYMKKVKEKNNQKSNRKKKNASPFKVFGVTLLIVLFVGMMFLLAVKYLPVLSKEEGTPADTAMQDEGFHFFWESVPEEKEAVAEVTESSRYAGELADEEYRKENRIYAWEADSKEEVTVGFIGDILFDDEYAIMANLLRRGVTIDNGISPDMLAMLQKVDILVANNEFPFTDRGTPTEEKAYTFRADTGTVSYLHDMGVDAAVLANNHIYDFGEVGLLDTLDTLEGAGIPYVGAGRNLKEASAPVYYIVNDMKIALVAATQIERLDNPDTKGATQETAGVFRCWDPELLYETVKLAKENSDFVIVYIHWGTENVSEPDWAQLEQAPKLAEAGADLIIGDHPHCLQGITYFDDTPVIYSMGNFWFNSKTVDTGMVKVTINRDGLKSFQFIPAVQSDCRVNLAAGEEKERILSYMRDLSPGVTIDGEGYVNK